MRLDSASASILSGVVADTSRATGKEFLISLVRSLSSLLEVRYCLLTECLDQPPTRVRSVAFCADGRLMERFEYSVLETPCERVVLGESRICGRDIQALFPDDEDLVTLGVESYAAVPILDDSGLVLGHLAVMDSTPFEKEAPSLDLLEVFAGRAAAEMIRARAVQSVQDSESRLRQVIDLVPQFIFAKDESGRFILANESTAEAYGTTVDDLIGRTDVDFATSREEAEGFRRGDLEVIRGGRPKIFEEAVTDSDGHLRHLQTTKIPFTFANSDLPAVLGVSTDISRRLEMEEQQRRLQEQVLQGQKAESLAIMAGGVAHDFNNFLTSIMGNVDLAIETLAADAPARVYLEEVSRAAQHSANLVAQMLAYTGKSNLVTSRIDLNALIRDMSDLLRRSISKKVALDLDLAGDLPAVTGDEVQIRQVVMNLILNASDAVGDAEGTIRLRTFLKTTSPRPAAPGSKELQSQPFIALEVTDTGCGMDPQTLDRIFDPFFTTKKTGRGLGLAALLGIVRSHGGTTKVESRPGEGTTFTILFSRICRPAEVATLPVDKPTPTTPFAAERSRRLDQKAHILLADDEEVVRQITQRLLEHLGCTVEVAEDGRRAVDLFADRPDAFDAVVLDITMPKLNGLEALEELRRIDPSVRVLLASGYSERITLMSEDLGETLHFLKKPFRPAELKEKLKQVLA